MIRSPGDRTTRRIWEWWKVVPSAPRGPPCSRRALDDGAVPARLRQCCGGNRARGQYPYLAFPRQMRSKSSREAEQSSSVSDLGHRSTRSSRAGLRLVHGRVRHARSERGQGVAGRAGGSKHLGGWVRIPAWVLGGGGGRGRVTPFFAQRLLQEGDANLGCRGNPCTRYSPASLPDARTVRLAALRGAPVATPFPAGVSRALH
jgi:hypothetical protein